jgi:hypothetical protein
MAREYSKWGRGRKNIRVFSEKYIEKMWHRKKGRERREEKE